MTGFVFTRFTEEKDKRDPFKKLLDLLLELLTYTSGEVQEALDWMRELDKTYKLTDENYSLDDFIEDLLEKGFFDKGNKGAPLKMSAKTEKAIRQRSLDQIFGKLKKSTQGEHSSRQSGNSEEPTTDRRNYTFGDRTDRIDYTNSIRNAQIRNGISGNFNLLESDLEIFETEYKTSTSTVLMIDISHSMILYGEDRITPAKKVAMALSEFVTRRYPKDTLDIVVFGNEAWQISIKDLPYLRVGPFHTNTVAGLELAMNLLRRRKNNNKQIFMITDGKPSCIKENNGYYKNSIGLDPYIVNKCLNLADSCRKSHIPVTTFMIASDPYLQNFVKDFTEANQGQAYYTGLEDLGSFIFEDYARNRKRRL